MNTLGFDFRQRIDAATPAHNGNWNTPSLRVIRTRLRARKIPLSRACHVGGWFNHRRSLIRYESRLELRAVATLSARQECVELETQPLTVHYTINGQHRRYTPDLLVVLEHVSPALASLGFEEHTLLEVKPDALAHTLRPCYAARRAVVRAATGLRLIMIGEEALRLLEWEVRHGRA